MFESSIKSKKLGKTEKSNNYRIWFNFPSFFFFFLGGVRLSKSKYGLFSMSGTATLLSKYGNAVHWAGPLSQSRLSILQWRSLSFVDIVLGCPLVISNAVPSSLTSFEVHICSSLISFRPGV